MVGMKDNVETLDGGAFNDFSARNKSTINEQKDDILIHSSIENFQPGTTAK